MLTAKDNLRNRLLFIAWGGVKDFWCVTILNLHDTPPPKALEYYYDIPLVGSRFLLFSFLYTLLQRLIPYVPPENHVIPPKKSPPPPTPSGDKYDWFLKDNFLMRIFYSIVTNFDFHWPVFPRLDSREYLCTWVTLQRGHLSRTLYISHRCVFYRLLGNWGDISKPVINRIGNHVHVLYRYIAIAGNRSRCSGSQSVAEVLAVSVVKVVEKEKNKL